MFLALREMRRSRGKFSLILVVISLVCFLAFFLTSLAYGLASSYTEGLERFGADGYVLNGEADGNSLLSLIGEEKGEDLKIAGAKAYFGVTPAVLGHPESDGSLIDREEVYVFGIDSAGFLLPEGHESLSDGEALVDQSLKGQGYALGDTLGLSGSSLTLKVAGFVDGYTYQTAPMVLTTIPSWRQLRFGMTDPPDLLSGVAIKGEVTSIDESLEFFTSREFAFNLPGYMAQVLTFGLMIGFLILIDSLVIAIFVYVLTTQKTNLFGVMKAEGIPDSYISASVLDQTMILTLGGMVIGLALALILGFALPSSVPFALNPLFLAVIAVLFVTFAGLGGLFSVRQVLRIDPLVAMGKGE